MDINWIQELNQTIPRFLSKLERPHQPGRFDPCLEGTTTTGESLSLGFSCLALKTAYTVGCWDQLDEPHRRDWIRFIKSFQTKSLEQVPVTPYIDGAFCDDNLALKSESFLPRLKRVLRPMKSTRTLSSPAATLSRAWAEFLNEFTSRGLNLFERNLLAETKQAICTLQEVNEEPAQTMSALDFTKLEMRRFLNVLNWKKPWAAGGQASGMVALLASEIFPGTREQKQGLMEVIATFFDELSDPETGGYFIGSPPGDDQLVSGAMKILSALDWMDEPIHYPENLIDRCLDYSPDPEGCLLVNPLYVLHRCLGETPHRKREVQDYTRRILAHVRKHTRRDGGFSYYLSGSQHSYYSARISRGLPVSDIHGTCILSWATAMAMDILDCNDVGWRILKP